MEAMSTFPICVTLPDGRTVTERVYACTKWHAIELLFTRMMGIQPNRSCYRLARLRRKTR